MKIVLDTNCLLVVVPRRSKYHWFYELLKKGELRLAVNTEILMEYEEVLSDFYAPEFAEFILKTIINLPDLEEINLHFKLSLIYPDLDDNKFVDTAFASNADFIITHDKHFTVLDKIPFPKIRRISLPDFYFLWFGKPMPDVLA